MKTISEMTMLEASEYWTDNGAANALNRLALEASNLFGTFDGSLKESEAFDEALRQTIRMAHRQSTLILAKLHPELSFLVNNEQEKENI
jgi:hypothetical protein